MFCSKCGKEVDENDKFCGNCGAEIKNTGIDSNKKKEKKKLKKWQKVIIIVIVTIVTIGIIANIVNYKEQQDIKRNADLYLLEHPEFNNKKTTQDSNVEKTIKAFAETIRNNNNGELKFNSYSKYKTTSNGIVIYQIKYNTSYDTVKSYQLVSLNKDNTNVEKSTNVYGFYVNYDGSLTGEKNQFEYEAEKIWGK